MDKAALQEICKLSLQMKEFKDEPTSLIDALNKLDKSIIQQQISEYEARETIEKVVKIRYKVLQQLLKAEIDEAFIEQTKEGVRKEYPEKNILQNWGNFGILYTLYYDQYRQKVESFLKQLANEVISDLGLREAVSQKVVGFDGPQNNGSTQVWMAIYNKNHETQKTAKQLYFSIGGGFNPQGIAYGLNVFLDQQLSQIIPAAIDTFSYNTLVSKFRQYSAEIVDDNPHKLPSLASALKTETEAKNTILFGPPGTGKTYITKSKAVRIIAKV